MESLFWNAVAGCPQAPTVYRVVIKSLLPFTDYKIVAISAFLLYGRLTPYFCLPCTWMTEPARAAVKKKNEMDIRVFVRAFRVSTCKIKQNNKKKKKPKQKNKKIIISKMFATKI